MGAGPRSASLLACAAAGTSGSTGSTSAGGRSPACPACVMDTDCEAGSFCARGHAGNPRAVAPLTAALARRSELRREITVALTRIGGPALPILLASPQLEYLEQNFVDRLVADMTAFLLGGRAWVAEHIDHKDRVLRVREAPRGRKPTWGGFIPQMLGFELCQRIRQVLVEELDYAYLDPPAQAVLREAREDLGPLLRRDVRPIQLESGEATWWTFAGGRINATLKYLLAVTKGWRVVADNFFVRVEGDGVTHDTMNAEIDRIVAEDVLADADVWRRVAALLPEYRLSKFQPALPDAYAVEVVAGYLLDGLATRAWLRGWSDGATAGGS